MKQNKLFNHAVQEGLLFLLISGGLMWYSLDAYGKSYIKDWTQSPSLFPLIVSVLLGVLAAATLIRGLRAEAAEEKKPGGQTAKVIILLALCIAYYLALALIELPYMAVTVFSMTFALSTFELATAAFLLCMMLFMGVRKYPLLIAVPLGTTAVLSIIFRTLLRVLLP